MKNRILKPIGIPKEQSMWIRSSYVKTLTTANDFVPNINYINNPTSSGVTPLFVTEMAALYKYGFVEKVKYQIKLVQAPIANPCLLGFVPSTSSASLGGIGDIGSLGQYQHCKTYCIPTGTSPQSEVIAQDTIRVGDYYPYKNWQDADELLTDIVTPTAPTQKLYLHCVNLSGATALFLVTVLCLVHFSEPRFVNT